MTSTKPEKSRKLPARYANLVMPLALSTLMSFVVSGISTLKAVGLSPQYPSTWMGAWGVSWLVSYPTLLIVLPIVRRLVALIVDLPENHK